MKIAYKLTLYFLGVSAVTIALVSVSFYQAFKNALVERTFAQLSSINQLKKDRIEDYYLKKPIPDSAARHTYYPSGEVTKIVQEYTGMGKTGESYIVGADFRLRTPSRFYPQQAPQNTLAITHATQKAFAGEEGFAITTDYRQEQVLSVFRKLNINGVDWVLISEIDLAETIKPITTTRYLLFWLVTSLLLLMAVLTFYLARQISQPILRLKKLIENLSKGVLPQKPIITDQKDEIGQMTKAIQDLVNGLQSTSLFALQIGNGNFDTQFQPLSNGDTLGIALLQMREKLKQLKEKDEMLNRQRTLALVEGQENERGRLARELHDGISQLLTAIGFRLSLIEGQPELQDQLKTMLNEVIEEVKNISNNLTPRVLLDFGLEAGIRLLGNNLSKETALNISFNFEKKHNKMIGFDINISLYRIVQEALNNIVRYAAATQVAIRLIQAEDSISLQITDNGKGFDIPTYQRQNTNSNGLYNMRERAKMLGGEAVITSQKGQGTNIAVEIPLK